MVHGVYINGYIDEMCYFYIDDSTSHGFIIDPGGNASKLLGIITENGWTIEKILLTHGHFDHIGAVNTIREKLDIPVLAHERSDEYLLDTYMNLSSSTGAPVTVENVIYVRDGDSISLEGNKDITLKVIYTPGHTTDSVIYYSEKDGLAFTGDTIFMGTYGNYMLPGGNYSILMDSIRKRVLALPDDTVLYSGHSDSTTVRDERPMYM